MERATLMDVNYPRILVSPRATIRAIVDRDPRERVIALVAISGLVGGIAGAVSFRSPQAFTIGARSIPLITASSMWKLRLAQVIASPLLAIAFLYINASILRWSGGLFGGTARPVELRAALGWSSVASILAGLILIAFTLIDPPAIIAVSNPPSALALLARDWPQFVLSTVLSLYAFVISVNCIAEVHRFSAWRALGAITIQQMLVVGVSIVLATAVPLLAVFLLK